MNEGTVGTPLTLLSSDEVWDRVDPLAPDLGVDPARAGLSDFPYAKLSGPGFERLCYELLVADGRSPRFFGRSGQKDYGVDIVVGAGDTRTVYQCKNLADAPAWTEVRDAIAKFESDWLGEAGLPCPQRFVYCCPHLLDHEKLGKPWTRFMDEFRARTGVELSFWNKGTLDTRLRRLPDVVAGLFSGSYAEHFCGRDNWRLDDPWTRVRWGEARHRAIERFLDRHKSGAIHISDQDEERSELLSGSDALAIRGLPGSGKTFWALELGCRMRSPLRRLYYATLNGSSDPERLWQSVRRRCSLPALFVLDDCHQDLEGAGMVRERLRPELENGTVKLLLVLRDLPRSASGGLDDTPEWLVQLEQDRAVIVKTDLKRTRAVTEHLRPDLVGLSTQRLERLHHFTGGDLLLLDELLSAVTSPLDLDALRPDKLYDNIRNRYFGRNRRLPTIRRLACLAQFELTPLESFLDGGWPPDEKHLAAPLMTELFAPPRYPFLHPSLAELVLRALLTLEVSVERLEEKVADATGSELAAYFRYVLASQSKGTARDTDPMASLETVLRIRLKLVEGAAEARIKAHFLGDAKILTYIEAHLDRCTFTFLHICLTILAIAAHPAKGRYVELIEKRFRILFQREREGSDTLGLATVGTGFFALARNAPATLETVQTEHGAGRFLRLITANGTLFELFRVLQRATPSFREALLGQLDDATVGKLVDKTIAAGRSMESFHYTLCQLARTPGQRERLEAWLEIEGWWRLIIGIGTLNSLRQLSRAMSDAVRGQFIRASSGLSPADWRGIIARGLFLNACTFATEDLATYPESSQNVFHQALGETAAPLAAEASWFDLNPSRPPTDLASVEGRILREALQGADRGAQAG